MRPIATDRVAWSVCMFVCWSRSWALKKTAEPIEMRFGGLTCVGPTNHALDRGRYPQWKEAILGCPAHSKTVWVSAAVYVAKGIIQSSTVYSNVSNVVTDLLTFFFISFTVSFCFLWLHIWQIKLQCIYNNGTTCDATFCQYYLTTWVTWVTVPILELWAKWVTILPRVPKWGQWLRVERQCPKIKNYQKLKMVG